MSVKKYKQSCIVFILHESMATELLAIYEHHLTSFEYPEPYEKLLAEHVKDQWASLKDICYQLDKLRLNQKTAKWNMSNSDALAFYQIWNMIDTSAWPLATVIINDMVKKIDKRMLNPKAIGIGKN